MRKHLKRLLTLHWTLTMFIMCVSVFVFSASTFNLFFMLKANFRFIANHGLMAIEHGGLLQLGQLLAYILIAATSYIVFRACERLLTDWLMQD